MGLRVAKSCRHANTFESLWPCRYTTRSRLYGSCYCSIVEQSKSTVQHQQSNQSTRMRCTAAKEPVGNEKEEKTDRRAERKADYGAAPSCWYWKLQGRFQGQLPAR